MKTSGKCAYDNSLSLIKLLAAFQVMIGHIITLLDLPFSNLADKVLYFFKGVPIFL